MPLSNEAATRGIERQSSRRDPGPRLSSGMATEERVQHISSIPPGRSDFLQSFTGYLSEPAEGALSPVFLSHENSENRPLRSSGRQIHSADGHAGGRL